MMETFYISLLGFIVLQHDGDLLYFIIRLYDPTEIIYSLKY